MGGNLILDILLDNPEKTFSISRFILQPRNHPELLRRWAAQTPEFVIKQRTAGGRGWASVRDYRCGKCVNRREQSSRSVFQDGESSESAIQKSRRAFLSPRDRGTSLGHPAGSDRCRGRTAAQSGCVGSCRIRTAAFVFHGWRSLCDEVSAEKSVPKNRSYAELRTVESLRLP